MKNYKIIYNPSSGKQVGQDKLFLITRKLLETQDIRLSIYATKKKNDAYEEILRTDLSKYDLVIACGGDGTINEVFAGIMDSPFKTKLALLPAGSVNDFAEHLKIPKDVSAYINMLESGKTFKTDVARINSVNYLINVLAGGAFTNIPHEVATDTKTILGKYAYYLQGAIELPSQLSKSYVLNVQLDKENFEVDAMIFLVANTSSVGGFKNMIPEASCFDGKLDLLIIKKSSTKELLEIFSKIISGEHVNHPNVIWKQSKNISISSVETIDIDIDGERGSSTPLQIETIKNAVEIIIP